MLKTKPSLCACQPRGYGPVYFPWEDRNHFWPHQVESAHLEPHLMVIVHKPAGPGHTWALLPAQLNVVGTMRWCRLRNQEGH